MPVVHIVANFLDIIIIIIVGNLIGRKGAFCGENFCGMLKLVAYDGYGMHA